MRKILEIALISAFLSTGCVDFKSVELSNSTKTVSVVCIGMENSAKYGKCPGAGVDAARMYNLFKQNFHDVTLLQSGAATKAAVVAAMENAAKADFMILFYSGHGGSAPGPEEDGRNEYLCLYNAMMLDDEVWAIITKCKGRVWLIFDCCHSETMYREYDGFRMSMLDDMAFASGSGVNLLCWSGCPDNAYSYGDAGGGKFTNSILRNFSKKITYDKWWHYIEIDYELKDYQKVRRTILGHGFDGIKAMK